VRGRGVRAAGRRRPLAWQITSADKLFLAGRYGKAERRLDGVVAELEAAHADDPEDAEVVVLLATTSYLLGVARHRLGRNGEAATALRLSIGLLTPLHAAPGSGWGRQLASAVQSAASVERDLEHWPEALDLSRRALELWTELPGDRWASYLAYALRSFAHVRAKAGVELDEALLRVDESIGAYAALAAAQPDKPFGHQVEVSQLVRTMVLDAMARHPGPGPEAPDS